MWGVRLAAWVWMLGAVALAAHAQRLPTLPGAWPLTGAPQGQAQEALPLPDRSVDIPGRAETSPLGVDVSAGYLFEGSDPTRRRDDPVGPSHRHLPREARDQPPGIPGVTVTVPLPQ